MIDYRVVSMRTGTGTEGRNDSNKDSITLTSKRWIIVRLLVRNGHSLEDLRIFDDGEGNLLFGQDTEDRRDNKLTAQLASKAPEKVFRRNNFIKQATSGTLNQSTHTASYAAFLRQTEVNDGDE